MTNPRFLANLRGLLAIDAATCAIMGAALTLATAAIAELTRLPASLLYYAGLSLFPIAVLMAVAAARPLKHPVIVWVVVVGNVVWAAGSIMLLVSGWIAPNAFGSVFLVAQAVAVAILAKLEHRALRAPAPGLA